MAAPTADAALTRRTDLPQCEYDPEGYATPHGEDIYVRIVLYATVPDGSSDVPNLSRNLDTTCSHGGPSNIENYSINVYGDPKVEREFEVQFDLPGGTNVTCVAQAIETTTGVTGVKCNQANYHQGPGGP